MKWGSVKQARQQAKRMEAKGIRTDASETFKAAQKAIKDNIAARIDRINENADLTKKEKTAQRKAARAAEKEMMETAAKNYLESGMATISGIKQAFEEMKEEYPDEELSFALDGETFTYNPRELMEEATKGDAKLMAEYMDADENHRKEMEARHIVGSDAIQQLAEAQQSGKYSEALFYDNLRKTAAAVQSGRIKSADELQTFIKQLDEEARLL